MGQDFLTPLPIPSGPPVPLPSVTLRPAILSSVAFCSSLCWAEDTSQEVIGRIGEPSVLTGEMAPIMKSASEAGPW